MGHVADAKTGRRKIWVPAFAGVSGSKRCSSDIR
jgi:hypothetical protein